MPTKQPSITLEARIRGLAPRILIAITLAALVAAWLNRFVQDDAFIAFHYAKRLVAGEGLTWFGAHVEGYTDFLWVLWIALGLALGISPVTWSYLGGLIAFLAVIHITWRMARLVLGDALPSLLAVLLLVGNYSTVAYATGGLETMPQTAILSAAVLLLLRFLSGAPCSPRAMVALGLLLAGAILLRPDSVLPAVIVGSGALLLLRRRRERWTAYASLILPLVVLVGGWLIWKISYYGQILPNTFHAKVGIRMSMLRNGVTYVGRYLHAYLLWPFLASGVILWLLKSRRLRHSAGVLTLLCLAWCLYVVLIGGDFMEFRSLIPITPYLSILLAQIIYVQIGTAWLRRGLTVAALSLAVLWGASLHHAVTFKGLTEDRALDSIQTLATCYDLYPDRDWDRIGLALRSAIGAANPVVALHPVGAIPFISGITTVDMWGLNDRNVAEHGTPAPPSYRRPGHQRHATLRYLRDRGVNFVIGHPTIVPRGMLPLQEITPRLELWLRTAVQFNREPIGEATLVVMPLDSRSGMLMWYLQPSPALDEIIARGGWERRTLRVG